MDAPQTDAADREPAASRKAGAYREIDDQLAALFDAERDGLANAANMAAVLYSSMPSVNWAGFYFLHRGELVLGPFQGKVACVRIGLGKGVCGTAAARREVVVVADVQKFPGHIACDPDSRSEIVVPLMQHGALVGVLDIDSPIPGRFDETDRQGLTAAAQRLCASSDFSRP